MEESDSSLNEQIDAAYQAKYRLYPSSVGAINSLEARAATLRLVPR